MSRPVIWGMGTGGRRGAVGGVIGAIETTVLMVFDELFFYDI